MAGEPLDVVLVQTVTERGCLQPIGVQATRAGQYRIIDGERRYKAAVLASQIELPAIVRDAGADEAEAEAESLPAPALPA